MRFLISLALLVLASTAFAEGDGKLAACAVPGYNSIYVAGAGLYIGGEQDAAQLGKLKGLGVRHVIDLRASDAEGALLPEAQTAKALGFSYQRIAVRNAEDLTRDKAKLLDEALAAAKGEPVLIHCSTGNRAAALLALRDVWMQNKAPEQALGFSERSGLSKLAPEVRRRLGGVEPQLANATARTSSAP
jgi:uncharacterized protein (TIGR01244 family)